MGQRQDKPEIIYGDDCLTCFEEGKTPKYVYARFSKVQKCTVGEPNICVTPANDKVFKLTQLAEEPCVWRYIGTYWRVFFRIAGAAPGENYLILDSIDGFPYFRSFFDDCIEEGQVLDNINPPGDSLFCGTGGIGIVTWRLETLLVMGLINIETASDLFMEMRPLDDGSRVYKYCKLEDATNIAIKYNP